MFFQFVTLILRMHKTSFFFSIFVFLFLFLRLKQSILLQTTSRTTFTMWKGKKAESSSIPVRSGAPERGRLQTAMLVPTPAQKLHSRDITNYADSATRASGAASATTSTPTPAMLRPTFDTVESSSSRTASRLPVAINPASGSPNYVAHRIRASNNDNRPPTRANQSSALPHRPQAPSTSLSLSGVIPSSVVGDSSARVGRYPWLDGPDYSSLYREIKYQGFEGYKCIDVDMVQPSYRIPDRSVGAVLQHIEEKYPKAALLEGQHLGSEYVGFSKSQLLAVSQRRQGLTLGEAVQKLYMSRLRETNRLLPMTKVYEGGWTLKTPGKEHPKPAGTVWLGDVVDSVNFGLLKQRNITAMVSIHPRDFRSMGQEKHGKNGEVVLNSPVRWHLQLQLADSKEADLESELEAVFEFIRLHIFEGRNVLVHCIAGLSRSVAVVQDFIQRIEVKRGRVDMSGTATERYLRMRKSRDATFQRLRMMRPGISEDNFRDQLDNSTMRICGLLPRPKPAAASKQKSKEHGGGGYMGDAIAMVFFFYKLRTTSKVLDIFEKRRTDHARKARELGQRQNGFLFPTEAIQWFQDCSRYTSSRP